MQFEICLPCTASPDAFVNWVNVAEQSGFQSIWLADMGLQQHDVFVYLTLLALHTKHARIGACVHHPFGRHPAVTLNGVLSIDELSNGRAAFGLGIGGGIIQALGLPSARVTTIRSIVTNLRALMSGERVTSETSPITLREAEFPDSICRQVPIHLAATGPKMFALAGELADGVFAHIGCNPEIVQATQKLCTDEALRADRDCSFSPFVHASIRSDREAAFADCHRGALSVATRGAQYLHHMDVSQTTIDTIGQEQRVDADLVDALTLSGRADDLVRKVSKLSEIGVKRLTIYPVSPDPLVLMESFGQHVIRRFA